jgi:hypothetical protein
MWAAMEAPTTTHDLTQIQNWLQTVIAHPEGVIHGVQSPEARNFLDIAPEDIENVLTRSQAQSAIQRLSVYANAYYARLVECMSEEFPALKYALGDEVFAAFAVSYLHKYPSRTYTLMKLASDFPRFLEETRPARDGDVSAPDWADFLIDLANLELAFSEVFDGPGAEGQRLLDAAQLAAVPAERLSDAILIPVGCLRLLTLRFPAHEYLTAVRKKKEAALPSASHTYLAVTRRNYAVRHYELSYPAFKLLIALVAGKPVGQAIMEAVNVAPDMDVDALECNLHSWFFDWAAEGMFQAVELR